MSTVRAAFNISATIVKLLVKVAGFGFVADAIEGGKEIYQLACSLKDETFGSAEAQMSGALRNSITDELAAIEDQLGRLGHDEKSIDLFIGRLETSAKRTIARLLDDENALGEAITEPAKFHAYVLTQSAPERANYTPEEEHHLDSLIHCIADEYLTLAPKSPNYNETALRATVEQLTEIRTTLEEIKDGQQDLKDGQQDLKDGQQDLKEGQQDLKAGQQRIESSIESLRTSIENGDPIRHKKQLKNAVWGSRPGPLEYWIERNPTCNSIALHDAIFGPDASDEATCCVLIGPAGSGKTRLAASIAKRCEDEEWTLIAWIDAESKDMIKNQVIAISEEKFGLQLKPNEYPEVQFNRALSSFPSQNREKILIVLDNVEKSASIDELLPKTPNVRVIVTTRHGGNWSHQHGWLPFNLSTFSRQESIQLLTQATGDDDKATANQIAQLLGDLPLAIGRAANTCAWLNINRLTQYYAMLQQYPTEKLLDSTVATRDSVGVISALQIAGASALERIVDPDIREYAENILSALCYLSEYGVPVHWLKDESDLFSMCAYSELIDSSLIDETKDGTTVSIHRHQAHAMRLHWTPDVRDKAAETVSMILTRQLMRISSENSHEKAKKATRQLIEQISTMSKQSHSHFIFKCSEVQEAIFTLLKEPLNLELYYESLTLYEAVILVAKLSESDCKAQGQLSDSNNLGHERLHRIIHQFEQAIIGAYFSWTFTESELIGPQFALAKAHEAAGHLDEAIIHYAKLVNTCAAIDGPTAPFTMKLRENLEAAKRELEKQEEKSPAE